VNERWGVGLSLFAPGGVGDSFASDSPQRYLVEDWNMFYISLSPAVGYRWNEELSLGAAVNLNYVSLNYDSAVFNGPGEPDGSLELRADDLSIGFQLGLLYELSPRTRVGLGYRFEGGAEPSGEPDFSGLTPAREAVLEAAGLLNQEIDFETTFPQLLGAGVYHEFGDGYSTTADLAWMDFSEFGLSEIAIGDSSIETREQRLDDVWFFAASLAKRLDEKWTAMIGAMYLTSGVSDENRTFTFRMDEIWGVGIGAEYDWTDRLTFGCNLNYYFLGDAPVETDVPLLGPLRGEFTDREALSVDLTLSWGF